MSVATTSATAFTVVVDVYGVINLLHTVNPWELILRPLVGS